MEDHANEIVVRHVIGCPHLLLALARVDEAVRVARVDVTISVEPVTTDQEAAALKFAGSPTVLIDGRDPFPADTIGLSCRLYATDDGPQGAPTVAQLVEVLRR
jgi:hypothetical protein